MPEDQFGWFIELAAKLGPLAISLAVAVVAYWQWRTANAKVVNDLRAERMAVYKRIRSPVYGHMLALGDAPLKVVDELRDAKLDAVPLFGDDFVKLTDELYRAATQFHAVKGSDELASEAKARLQMLMQRVDATVLPYVRMTQKINWLPCCW